jgi:hypothetical protein
MEQLTCGRRRTAVPSRPCPYLLIWITSEICCNSARRQRWSLRLDRAVGVRPRRVTVPGGPNGGLPRPALSPRAGRFQQHSCRPQGFNKFCPRVEAHGLKYEDNSCGVTARGRGRRLVHRTTGADLTDGVRPSSRRGERETRERGRKASRPPGRLARGGRPRGAPRVVRRPGAANVSLARPGRRNKDPRRVVGTRRGWHHGTFKGGRLRLLLRLRGRAGRNERPRRCGPAGAEGACEPSSSNLFIGTAAAPAESKHLHRSRGQGRITALDDYRRPRPRSAHSPVEPPRTSPAWTHLVLCPERSGCLLGNRSHAPTSARVPGRLATPHGSSRWSGRPRRRQTTRLCVTRRPLRHRAPVSTLRNWDNDRGFPAPARPAATGRFDGSAGRADRRGGRRPGRRGTGFRRGRPPKGAPEERAVKRPRGRPRKLE